MKIRHGFVSNSSSSSFVIGYDNMSISNMSCPQCGHQLQDETRVLQNLVTLLIDKIKDYHEFMREGKSNISQAIKDTDILSDDTTMEMLKDFANIFYIEVDNHSIAHNLLEILQLLIANNFIVANMQIHQLH